MAMCYKKLWKLLIDKNLNKSDLRERTGLSTTTIAKLGRDEYVSMEVVSKIWEISWNMFQTKIEKIEI